MAAMVRSSTQLEIGKWPPPGSDLNYLADEDPQLGSGETKATGNGTGGDEQAREDAVDANYARKPVSSEGDSEQRETIPVLSGGPNEVQVRHALETLDQVKQSRRMGSNA